MADLEINSENDVKCKISEEVIKIKEEFENPEKDIIDVVKEDFLKRF